MPVDSFTQQRFVLLEGLPSVLEAMADPAHASRLAAWDAWDPGYRPPVVGIVDEVAAGPHGPIPVRVYTPSGPQSSPARERRGLVWLHGGGWLAGDLDMPESDVVARELAHRADAVVVAVDYRLALDGVTFPVPHDDVVAAFRWVAAHADRLRISGSELALGGASAGANLACGAAQRLRDDKDSVLPDRLLLAYPPGHLDLPAQSAEHELLMRDIPVVLRFSSDVIRQLATNYLGFEFASESAIPPYASPINGDLKGLPPTTIITSEYDDLRPSGEILGQRIVAAGGDVEVVMEAGALHGHLNWDPRRALVDHSLAVFAQALKRAR